MIPIYIEKNKVNFVFEGETYSSPYGGGRTYKDALQACKTTYMLLKHGEYENEINGKQYWKKAHNKIKDLPIMKDMLPEWDEAVKEAIYADPL